LENNLNIVLTVVKYKYVLIDLEIGENYIAKEGEAEKAWKKTDQMARYFMLASVSNVLLSKH
jgi:hypothetical protein